MQKNNLIQRFGGWLVPAFLPFLLLQACAPSRMAVPQDLSAKTQPMPVTKKKFWYIFNVQRMRFGPYTASAFNQGWTHGSSWSVAAYSSSTYKQRYGFTLKPEQGPDWRCECGAKASQKAVDAPLFGGTLTIPLEQKASLNCSLQDSRNGPAWTLALTKDATETAVFAGDLSDGKKRIQVESTDLVEGVPFPNGKPMGYLFREGDRVLGAVGTVNKEEVWLDPGVGTDLRPQLATVASALLVYQDMLEAIENKDK